MAARSVSAARNSLYRSYAPRIREWTGTMPSPFLRSISLPRHSVSARSHGIAISLSFSLSTSLFASGLIKRFLARGAAARIRATKSFTATTTSRQNLTRTADRTRSRTDADNYGPTFFHFPFASGGRVASYVERGL